MSRTLIFASHNAHKASEIKALLPADIRLHTLEELAFHEEIPETGNTLEENANIKAATIFKKFNLPCFADDTGLEVDALKGAPGVWSARYAGPDATFEDNWKKLLSELGEEKNRSACFRTVICYIDGNGAPHYYEGRVNGSITNFPSGTDGFGYDPVFKPESADRTFAEMSLEEKNKISHRGLALAAFVKGLGNSVR